MPDLTPGLALCRDFYADAVAPVVAAVLPGLPHAAAVMGRGSEVLGFDDAVSTDHDWRPRVTLFLTPDDRSDRGETLETALAARVPGIFAGHPTGVEVTTVGAYFLDHLGIDVDQELTARDWLATPEQQLAMCTAGAVFRDDIGLQAVRDRLGRYPHDVWLYLMSAAWWRLHPEVNLVGRTGSVGDELGSALIGARLVTDMVRLCFLMERRYAPYPKWFGTAFARLGCAAELAPLLAGVLHAERWPEREEALNRAYAALARRHGALRVTPPVVVTPVRMWDRPFAVTWGDFPGALQAEVRDPEVRRLVERWPAGGVDQLREVLWHQRSRDQLLRALE
ncbi:DUF4037 domain-containing protein [Microlunatus lacustris]